MQHSTNAGEWYCAAEDCQSPALRINNTSSPHRDVGRSYRTTQTSKRRVGGTGLLTGTLRLPLVVRTEGIVQTDFGRCPQVLSMVAVAGEATAHRGRPPANLRY